MSHRLVVGPRRVVLLVAVLAGGVLALGLLATVSTAAAVVPTVAGAALAGPAFTSDPRAVALLRRSYQQARALSYHGTEYMSVGGRAATVRVSHVHGGAYLDIDPGGNAKSLRVWQPDSTDTAGATGATGANPPDPLQLISDHFSLVVHGRGTVAGRPTYIVQALHADGHAAAAFWVDAKTALLLRRETYDDNGGKLDWALYSDVDVSGPDPTLQGVSESLEPDGEWRDPSRLDRLRAAGWYVPPTLAGGLTLYDVRLGTAAGRPVLHLSYSDGIATVSVFEQTGRLDAAALAGWQRVRIDAQPVYVQEDSCVRAAWQGGTHVMAVIADAPDDTVAAVVAALPHGAPRDGVLDRLGRGFDRLGALANPFG